MSLEKLTDDRCSIHLMYSESNLAELLVYDTIKQTCEADLESTLTINNSTSFNGMLDLINIQPFLADRWFVVIEYKKVAKLLKNYTGIFRLDTCRFLIKTNNYKEFKAAKELIQTSNGSLNELYLAVLRMNDVSWLTKDINLSWKLNEFLYKSYSREPDKILGLVREVKNGAIVNDRKDIVNICGASSGSVFSYVMSLLTMSIKTERGANTSLKKKLSEAIDLSRTYGVTTFRNYLVATLRDIIDIKEMYLNGDIYDNIINLPAKFDEKRYGRYRYALKSILALPLNEVIGLYLTLMKSGYWMREVDVIEFIYKLYAEKVGAIG